MAGGGGFLENCIFGVNPGKGKQVEVVLDPSKEPKKGNVLRWDACKCGCERIKPKLERSEIVQGK